MAGQYAVEIDITSDWSKQPGDERHELHNINIDRLDTHTHTQRTGFRLEL